MTKRKRFQNLKNCRILSHPGLCKLQLHTVSKSNILFGQFRKKLKEITLNQKNKTILHIIFFCPFRLPDSISWVLKRTKWKKLIINKILHYCNKSFKFWLLRLLIAQKLCKNIIVDWPIRAVKQRNNRAYKYTWNCCDFYLQITWNCETPSLLFQFVSWNRIVFDTLDGFFPASHIF